MKALSIFFITCFAAISLNAQNTTVTVTINGNLNKQVYVDGVNYALTTAVDNSAVKRLNTAVIENVAAGQHTLQVINANQSIVNKRNSKIFNVRSGYNLNITVNGNGSISISETRSKRGRRDRDDQNNTTDYRVPMSDVNFASVMNDVRSTYNTNSKVAKINTVVTANSTYFTSAQVGQLLQLVTGDGYRLPLAKSAYNKVTDPENYSSITLLLRSQSSRNDLAAYIRSSSTQNSGGTYSQAMADATFRGIYNDIQSRYQMGSKVNALNSIFMTSGNYFTTNQVSQLLQLVSDENERFQLAKVAYRTVVNPTNYTTVVNSFSTQARRDELSYYIRAFNPQYPGPGYTYGGSTTNTTTTNYAMSDANFNTLYDNVRRQWLPGSKKSSVLEAFSNTGYFFSSAQAKMLIALNNDEQDRLDMAKASYRSIVDPANFSLLYDLFTTQYRRDELVTYVRNYVSGTSNDVYTSPSTKTPMADASFTVLYDDIHRQWFPGAKKSAVLTTFSNANNFFTTAQAIRLITLDNDEADRMDLAKASLRSIVDPGNVRQILDIFTTQAYRDDLTNYINNYRW
ncbi:MAG: DUF4476 domain-containing protein [Ferruginibacter sp.]